MKGYKYEYEKDKYLYTQIFWHVFKLWKYNHHLFGLIFLSIFFYNVLAGILIPKKTKQNGYIYAEED